MNEQEVLDELEKNKAGHELEALLNYLADEHKISLEGITLLYSNEEQELNLQDNRAFCSVDLSKLDTINCSFNINNLPIEVRVGILLHELGHIILATRDEIEVDNWCMNVIKQTGFKYISEIEYTSLPSGKQVIAKNIESVSSDFIDYLVENYMG